MIVCVVGAAGLDAGAALDRAVDVVVRDRGLLGLLDGVEQRRVAVRVAAADARRDLDVLDQLGEQLAALGVDHGLLVLGGRPFGVAGHRLSPSRHDCSSRDLPGRGSAALRTMSTKNPCTRSSPVSSGWNDGGQQRALANRDDPTGGRSGRRRGRAPRRRARPTPPTGARMNTACERRRRTPAKSTSASKDSSCRPKALRRTIMSMPPMVSWSVDAVQDLVGQHDHARRRCRTPACRPRPARAAAPAGRRRRAAWTWWSTRRRG